MYNYTSIYYVIMCILVRYMNVNSFFPYLKTEPYLLNYYQSYLTKIEIL